MLNGAGAPVTYAMSGPSPHPRSAPLTLPHAPPQLAERCIRAGTSERGACSQCGKPWVRVVDKRAFIAAD